MNTFEQAQVFFFISSVGFVILFTLIAIILFYAISAFKAFSRIAEKLEENIDTIGDTTAELIEDIKDSRIFNFIFGRRSSQSKKSKKHSK